MKPLRELSLSQLRISRAQENIKEFAQLLSEYLENRPARIRVNVDTQGHGTIRVERREPIPGQLSILLGEALQNLRAGLDNCLYAVAIIDSGTNPPPGDSQLQWPIALSPKEWTANKKRLQYLSPHLIEALHRIQPFQAENPGWNSLRILHDLARIDRHRAAHELAMRPEKVKGSYDKKIIHDLKIIEGPLDDEGIVVTFTRFGHDELTPKILDLQFELDIDVRDVETAPHFVTGMPSRPWGSLDKRLKVMCVAVESYADGLVELARNPDLARVDQA
ncbi:hypothetical protein [Corynebacterium dentalis]|uniref:hypothetical protein n=1 Tax=Corynebacterium dentalis TaxID=2014528 RepID=UPI00289B7905|nr:hypothetical protein [Corynebacterium dentalis]